MNPVASDYFSVLGIPFLTGRTFDSPPAGDHEVVISRSLAHEIWPHTEVVGRRFRIVMATRDPQPGPWLTVVGVVPDVVTDLLTGTHEPVLYQPLATAAGPWGNTLIVRTSAADPGPILQRLAVSVAPGPSRVEIQNVQEQLDQSVTQPRFTMLVLVVFGAVGVILAAVGIFGVISYSVALRTREIGARMTLGATRGRIARLVVGEGLRLATAGVALGHIGAAAGSRVIESMLYGVSRIDPFAFGACAARLLAAAAGACVAPVLRASSVDPATAMRAE